MKMMQQETKFAPIAVVLETREEAEAFWAAIRFANDHVCRDAEREITRKISNWFSNEAHL